MEETKKTTAPRTSYSAEVGRARGSPGMHGAMWQWAGTVHQRRTVENVTVRATGLTEERLTSGPGVLKI
jgi:hypothetical protein